MHVDTMLLGAGKLLQSRRHQLKGTVKLVFQAAEEGKGWAYQVLKGVLHNVQAILALHVSPYFQLALLLLDLVLSWLPPDFLSQFKPKWIRRPNSSSFHGYTCSPTYRFTRNRPIGSQVTGHIGWVLRVTAENEIPEEVQFGGTFRTSSSEQQSYIQRRIHEVIETQAQVMRGCLGRVEFMEKTARPYPATINDNVLYEQVKRVGVALVGEANVGVSPMSMGAEDFSFYSQKMAASYWEIGTFKHTLNTTGVHFHSRYFGIDEDALPIGAAFHAVVAISYLYSLLQT